MILDEAIRLVKKKFKYRSTMNDKMQYRLIYKDSDGHDFTQRVKDRTDLSPKEVSIAISKGIDYILKRIEKGKIDDNIAIGLTYKKSKFKAVFVINPWLKYIKIATILSKDMDITNAILWDINEGIL